MATNGSVEPYVRSPGLSHAKGLPSLRPVQTSRRKTRNEARIMAVAHTVLIIGYAMLRAGRSYHELGGGYLEQINKDQLQRYFVK